MQGSISFDGTLSGGITGGGGGGSEVTITPTLSSGTKIADYDIDGTPGELYAPTPEGLSAQAPLSISSGVISIDLSGYQEKLTAGSYISIDSDNEISCNPPITYVWYTPEPDVQQDVLIGKFTVNNVTQNVYAPSSGGGSGLNYSTTEQDTGLTWLDGSHIYQKTFKIENIAVSGNMSRFYTLSDYISNVSVPIKVEFLLKNNSTNVYYVMPYTLTGSIVNASGCCVLAGNEIILNTGSSFASFTGTLICTLKYTKSV